jgi:hypothetical protein
MFVYKRGEPHLREENHRPGSTARQRCSARAFFPRNRDLGPIRIGLAPGPGSNRTPAARQRFVQMCSTLAGLNLAAWNPPGDGSRVPVPEPRLTLLSLSSRRARRTGAVRQDYLSSEQALLWTRYHLRRPGPGHDEGAHFRIRERFRRIRTCVELLPLWIRRSLPAFTRVSRP